MKLLLRRDQRSGMLGGKPVFQLEMRASLSEEEKANIKKYKLGDTVLFQNYEVSGGSGLLGAASKLAWKAMNISISVKDLESGKQIEMKDIVELLAIEEAVKDAAATFKSVLDAAAHFGGEEVIEV